MYEEKQNPCPTCQTMMGFISYVDEDGSYLLWCPQCGTLQEHNVHGVGAVVTWKPEEKKEASKGFKWEDYGFHHGTSRDTEHLWERSLVDGGRLLVEDLLQDPRGNLTSGRVHEPRVNITQYDAKDNMSCSVTVRAGANNIPENRYLLSVLAGMIAGSEIKD